MKKIFFLTAVAALTVCLGCRNRSAHPSGETTHIHSETCTHDHSHDHDREGGQGDHCCEHDHTGHENHIGHSHGHDHGPDHAGCGHDHGAQEHPDDPQDIIFTAEQASLTDFRVAVAKPGPFREVIRAYGVISPAQGEQVSIVAPADGIVSFSNGNLTEGAHVGARTRLFTVSSSEVEGGDRFAVGRAALARARADYERASRLREDNIVSQAELSAIEAEYEALRIQYESLSEAPQGQGASVVSPVAGYVYGIGVTQGEFVERGRLLATVVRSRTMELRVEVSQRHYPKLAGVRCANFSVPSSPTVYNISELGGSLVSVGNALQPGSPLVPVVFRFPYNPQVVSGTLAEVTLLGAIRDGVLTLPLTAVTEQQGLHYVYVRTGGDVYRRREVTLGGSDGRRVEILSGLSEGEQVVVRGAVNVRMASASAAIPHSHEH